MRTSLSTSVIAALTVSFLPLATMPAPEATAQGCSAVHVLQAPGTGFSSRVDDGEPVALHFDGTNPAADLQERVGAWQVTTQNVPYPSSLGRFSAFQTSPRGSENLTYGDFVAMGVEAASDRMPGIAECCPGKVHLDWPLPGLICHG